MTRKAYLPTRYNDKTDLDFYHTPPNATRSFLDSFKKELSFDYNDFVVWEPANGMGHISNVLKEFDFKKIIKSDVVECGNEDFIMDFLNDECNIHFDCIITNPPYNKATEFIKKAFDVYYSNMMFCAFLVRLQFLEGMKRYNEIFSKYDPYIWVFSKQIGMNKGKLIKNRNSPMTFMWIVFFGKKFFETYDYPKQINFITKKDLEKFEYDEDYA